MVPTPPQQPCRRYSAQWRGDRHSGTVRFAVDGLVLVGGAHTTAPLPVVLPNTPAPVRAMFLWNAETAAVIAELLSLVHAFAQFAMPKQP